MKDMKRDNPSPYAKYILDTKNIILCSDCFTVAPPLPPSQRSKANLNLRLSIARSTLPIPPNL